MLNWYHPSRALRSTAFPSLVPNSNKTVRHGRRLCDTAAAAMEQSSNKIEMCYKCDSF